MRIDQINRIEEKCTGCNACVDACVKDCITTTIDSCGFTHKKINLEKCIECGKCYSVCPIENIKTFSESQRLYGCYSKEMETRLKSSSGGLFSILANLFLDKGYYVCAAAFDNKMKLCHRIIKSKEELPVLLKSKYIQSDMEGIYVKIKDLLKSGEKIFFCSTPCQVSALKNSLGSLLNENLFTAEILCHGVPSQILFDEYIKSLEKKHKGKIIDFKFRVKDNKYKHAHGYSYKVIEKNGKEKVINGVYSQSSYYYAFKKYWILRESCYACNYGTKQRVADITLGDFWGIEKYDFGKSTDVGVSKLITNSVQAECIFQEIKEQVVYREFPLEIALDSNKEIPCGSILPPERQAIMQSLSENGYEITAKKFFKDRTRFVRLLFWSLPIGIRNFLRKLRG